METYRKGVNVTNQTIKSAVLIPKWVTALFLTVLSLTVITLTYFGYNFIRFEENRKVAFEKGREEVIFELRGYFDNHPIIYRDFQKWVKKKHSVSNQE